MRKYKKWEHRKKYPWKKRMKHVRIGKDVVRDENNNTVHENDNYNIIYRDGCELWPFPYGMSVFFDFYTSLDRRGEAYNSDPVIGGIAGPCEPTAIPTVRAGKKSIKNYKTTDHQVGVSFKRRCIYRLVKVIYSAPKETKVSQMFL